jgi:drug/metabolite transporter (DMT)-like permease
MWFIVATVAGAFSALSRVITRKALYGQKYSVFLYSLLWQVFISLFIIPFALSANFKLDKTVLVLLFIQGASWVGGTLLGFAAQKRVGVTLTSIISRLRIIWVLFLSALFLGEVITFKNIAGIAVVLAGFVILFWKRNLKVKGSNYLVLTFLGTVFCAVGTIINTLLLRHGLSVFLVGFTMTYTQAIAILLIWFFYGLTPEVEIEKIRVSNLVVVSAFAEAIAVVGLNFALRIGPTVNVNAIYLSMSILVVWLGFVLWGEEKENLRKTIVSTVLVIIGVILLK